MADPLSKDILEGAIRGRLGRTLRFLEETSSTNSVALDWADAGAPEGALVVAENQSAGRGRWGRSWLSEPGAALIFSLVLRPKFPPGRVALISTAAGVACAEGLEQATGLAVRLKWPNDINVEARKLGGILVETRVVSGRLAAAVVGVGINVHWDPAAMPAAITASATSVSAELDRAGLGPPPPRSELLAIILERLEELYAALTDDASAEVVVERAEARSEILGQGVKVRFADGRTVEGTALRLLPTGALEIESEGGVVALESGEIEQLRRVP